MKEIPTGRQQQLQGNAESKGTQAFLKVLPTEDRKVVEEWLDKLDALGTARSRRKMLTGLATIYLCGLKHGVATTKSGRDAVSDLIQRMTVEILKAGD